MLTGIWELCCFPTLGPFATGLLVAWYRSSTDHFIWFPKSFLSSQIEYVFKYASTDCASPKRKFHAWAVSDLARFCFKTTLNIGHWITIHRQWFTSINCVWDRKVSALITTQHLTFPIKTFWFLFSSLRSDTRVGVSEGSSEDLLSQKCLLKSDLWKELSQRPSGCQLRRSAKLLAFVVPSSSVTVSFAAHWWIKAWSKLWSGCRETDRKEL